MFNNSPPLENHAVYEIMWKHTVELSRQQMTIWRFSFACWITKATNTYPEYVIVIFPQQQFLCQRATMLRYTYIVCLGLSYS